MENAQVFVKIEEYKDVLDTISLIKEKIEDARSTLAKLNEVKSQEDSEISSWSEKIAELETKISDVDNKLLTQ